MSAIELERIALCEAVKRDSVLKSTISAHTDKNTTFSEAWVGLTSRFASLYRFSGGLATVFQGTATIEADFSTIKLEKGCHRKRLSDYSLDGIQQAKQFKKLVKHE